MVSIPSAIVAPVRLTMDSTASESRPTEPVQQVGPGFQRERRERRTDREPGKAGQRWVTYEEGLFFGGI